VSAAHEASAARARVGKDPGGGATLNSPGNLVLACGPRTGGCARVGLGGGGGVPVGCGSTKGMTVGPQLSVTAARRRRGSGCGGLAVATGLAGPLR
jgi:hypothetical protein